MNQEEWSVSWGDYHLNFAAPFGLLASIFHGAEPPYEKSGLMNKVSSSLISTEHGLAPGMPRGQEGKPWAGPHHFIVIVTSLPRILRRAHW